MVNNRISIGQLEIDQGLHDLLQDEIIPETGIAAADFWQALEDIARDFVPRNKAFLARRDFLQQQIDDWYKADPNRSVAGQMQFLEEIGYLVPEGEAFTVAVDNVDDEIARIAGAQLVVPVDNARYALNAANARWGSLYDALYGTDVIDESEGRERSGAYNPVRGNAVIAYGRAFLDRAVPLNAGSHADATAYQVVDGQLRIVLADGGQSALAEAGQFAGYTGDPGTPDVVLLRNNGLHFEIRFDAGHIIGQGDAANVYDIQLESAVTTIMDCEDSVAVVDAEDKVVVYRNWLGLMRGTLTTSFAKGDGTVERALEPDRAYRASDGGEFIVSGRSLMLVRNVGIHMYTDAVTYNGEEIPEGFLDIMFTALAAKHDMLGNGSFQNSRTGQMYVVKPKQHGPDEVAATVELFARVEQALGMEANTIKIGIMDEERRTTANLGECIRAARERVIFINTGFLDRTGDEIHTDMEAGTVLPKEDLKKAIWLSAYEDWNVDTGLKLGLPGNAQIGKGMWPAPASMAAMVETKIGHPLAGASCAWVPSPTAATLHAMHYHEINVWDRQRELASRDPANLADILTMPVLGDRALSEAEIVQEIDNNVQGILGYVVRWVGQGVGCSVVPDINDVGLMEDRATLRISSQHIANWLYHGVVSEAQVMDAMRKMAAVVDQQNAGDPVYRNMAPNFDDSIEFQAAVDLVFRGRDEPNGYTEPVLHARRREMKARMAG